MFIATRDVQFTYFIVYLPISFVSAGFTNSFTAAKFWNLLDDKQFYSIWDSKSERFMTLKEIEFALIKMKDFLGK